MYGYLLMLGNVALFSWQMALSEMIDYIQSTKQRVNAELPLTADTTRKLKVRRSMGQQLWCQDHDNRVHGSTACNHVFCL